MPTNQKTHNQHIIAMIHAAGGQSALVRIVKGYCNDGDALYQSYIHKYAYERGSVSERMLPAFLKAAKELGLNDIKPHDLRPSLPILD